jgi:hypothetical protein
MKKYLALIHALGPEAKELRRLMVRLDIILYDYEAERVEVPSIMFSSPLEESDDGGSDDHSEMSGGENDAELESRDAESDSDVEMSDGDSEEGSEGSDDEDDDVFDTTVDPVVFEPESQEAELELEKNIGGLVYREASAVLILWVIGESKTDTFCFDCRISQEHGSGFAAEELSTEEAKKYFDTI